MDDDDSLFLTVADFIKLAHLTVVNDVALICAVGIYAAEHVHESGFTGSVFPHQRVDFSLFHLQVYIVKGFYSGEGLGDISHFQKYLCHSIPPTTIQAGISPRLCDSHLFRSVSPVHLITLTGLPCNNRSQSAFLCNYQL